MKRSLHVICLFLVPVFCHDSPIRSEDTVEVRNDQELRQALRDAKPGTWIRIAPGRYRGGHSVAGLRGTSAERIRISAAEPANPPVLEGGGNAIHFSDIAFVTVESLVIEGSQFNGLNIDDGGKADRPSHDVILKDLTVRNVGSDGNHDGLKLSGVQDFRIVDCDFSKWGRGGSAIDMVGCHRGEIQGCVFRGQETDAGNGVQAKGGSSEIHIFASRFENVGSRAVNLGGSTGLPFFRPIDAPFEAKNLTVEDCVFIGSPAPIAFVGVDGASVRHNTIYRPGKYVIRILQENVNDRFVQCRNGTIERNLIVFDPAVIGSTTNVGPKTMPGSFVYRGNAWASSDGRHRKPRHDIREEAGEFAKSPIFADAEAGDLTQEPTSPTREFGSRQIIATKPGPR
jgi:hypothetical protein